MSNLIAWRPLRLIKRTDRSPREQINMKTTQAFNRTLNQFCIAQSEEYGVSLSKGRVFMTVMLRIPEFRKAYLEECKRYE